MAGVNNIRLLYVIIGPCDQAFRLEGRKAVDIRGTKHRPPNTIILIVQNCTPNQGDLHVAISARLSIDSSANIRDAGSYLMIFRDSPISTNISVSFSQFPGPQS